MALKATYPLLFSAPLKNDLQLDTVEPRLNRDRRGHLSHPSNLVEQAKFNIVISLALINALLAFFVLKSLKILETIALFALHDLASYNFALSYRFRAKLAVACDHGQPSPHCFAIFLHSMRWNRNMDGTFLHKSRINQEVGTSR